MRALLATTTCLLLLALGGPVRLAANPQRAPAASLSRASAALQAGRFADAAREYGLLVDSDPSNGAAHVGLVSALLRLNRIAEAARAVARGCACRPNDASLLVASGDVSFRQGDFAGAAERYAAAIAVAPTTARAHWGLGRIDLAERRNRSAARHFVTAYRLAPHDPDILLDWASTLATRQERLAAAERYLALAADRDPQLLAGIRARIATLKALGERRTFVVVDARRAYRLPLGEALTPDEGLRGYRLFVLVNGERLRLIVDTGASGIRLNRKAADRCRLVPLAGGVPAKGIGDEGPRASELAIAETLRAGSLEMHDCEVEVDSGQAFEDADGVIGTDVFSRFLVKLDFPGQTLELLPPEAGEPSIAEDFWHVERRMRPGFTPVHVFGHLLLADARVNDVPGFLFVVDSGAPIHLMSTAAASRVTRLHVSDAVVRGVSGNVRETLTTGRVALAVGDLTQLGAMPAVNLDDQNSRAGTEISGVIGLDVLRQFEVTIDYTNGLVRLERPGR